MKLYHITIILSGLPFISKAEIKEWRNECVGYYQFDIPKSVELALYPVDSFTHPRPEQRERVNVITKRFRTPVITFGNSQYENGDDRAQAQFTQFYYDKYKIGISSESKDEINFAFYHNKVEGDYTFKKTTAKKLEEQDYKLYHETMTPEDEFNQIYDFRIKSYVNAFTVYDRGSYTIQLNGGRRIYQFWSLKNDITGDKGETAKGQLQKKEPEVISLLSRFSSRELYEIPTKKGFCIPYGFIAEDSGKVPHNMAVTYRLIDNPDITIFIQDLGMTPEAEKEDKLSPKEYVTWLWNWQYQWSAISKELIIPKWRTIKMAGRKGLGTFAKAEFKDGRTDYGYVAYVRGDHNARNVEPDLLVYVMQYSVQAKDRTPMDKKDLEKMAERIVASVKRR